MKRLLVCAALVSTSGVLACEPAPFDAAADATEATFVVVGYVVGDHYPDFEASIVAGDGMVSIPEKRTVRIAVSEALKGSTDKVLVAEVSCGAPFPRGMERAVVVRRRDGRVHVFPADYAEQLARKALEGGA